MIIKYNVDINNEAVLASLKRLTNQIYKLLPSREEGIDWKVPLSTIVEEIAGMNKLLPDQQDILFTLLCKLEGLRVLVEEDDFFLYRRTIFECLGLVSKVMENVRT